MDIEQAILFIQGALNDRIANEAAAGEYKKVQESANTLSSVSNIARLFDVELADRG